MKNVLVRLEEYLPRASGAERGALRYLLESPNSAVNCSIKQLAECTFTSASTIIRLCRKLGFDGYKEFHKALLCELAVKKETESEHKREIQREDGLDAIIQKVTYKNMLSLDNSRKLADREVLQKCLELLNSAQSIVLFGIGASLLVARDAYYKFIRVRKKCCFSDDWHLQLIHAQNTTPEDVAIVISYSGMTQETLRCAQTAKANRTPIIAITRFETSPLAKLADYNLYVASTELFFRSGAMSSRISQLNMIDILYAAYVNQNYEECIRRISVTHVEKEGKDSK